MERALRGVSLWTAQWIGKNPQSCGYAAGRSLYSQGSATGQYQSKHHHAMEKEITNTLVIIYIFIFYYYVQIELSRSSFFSQ